MFPRNRGWGRGRGSNAWTGARALDQNWRGTQRAEAAFDQNWRGTQRAEAAFDQNWRETQRAEAAIEQNWRETQRETTEEDHRNKSPMYQDACGTSADEQTPLRFSRGNTRWRQPEKKLPKETKRAFPTPDSFKPPTQQGWHSTFRPGNKMSKNYPVLDHKVIQTMKENSCDEVVNRLSEGMSNLKFILSSQEEIHTSDEFNFDLICALAIACDAQSGEKTTNILVALKGSVFFSTKVPTLLDRVQVEKTGFDGDTLAKLIQGLIKIFFKYMRHLPSSYADLPREQLQKALDQLKIERKDELQKQLDAFKQERDEVIRAERQRHVKRYKERRGKKPPDDFREMPVCPTNKEIVSPEKPFLRKNITKGRYEDTEHYLDVQFRLLREDFLEPLREGIHEITNNIPRHQCNQMMKRYNGVHIVGKELTMSGITYKVQFDVSRLGATRWAHSRRLIYGSFLCLSNDNFQTMLFATVANRDPDELKKGRFDVRFIEEQDIFGIEKRRNEYLMVESPAYFEAYRHVLKGLKELDEDNLPFKKYLVECSADVDPPEYIRREEDEDPAYYDLSKALADTFKLKRTLRAVPILHPEAWPSAKDISLNNSQLEALKTALTTEFSVIQGPPGTGKTYVGAKIVQCLLENRRQWDPEHISPMLMVCYTNHALDQFLEKVTEFLPKEEVIRVGGRCKSEHLEGCNVKRFVGRYRMNTRRGEIEDKIMENDQHIRRSQKNLKHSDKMILQFDDLADFINERHVEQLVNAIFPANAENECRKVANTFKLWLCDNQRLRDCNQRLKAGKGSAEKERHDGSIVQHEEPCDGVTEDDVFFDAAKSQTWLGYRENGCQHELKINSEQRNEEVSINDGDASSSNEIAKKYVDEMSISRPVESNESQHAPEVCDVATIDLNDTRTGSCLTAEALMLNSFGADFEPCSSLQSKSTTKKVGVFVQRSGLQAGFVQLLDQQEQTPAPDETSQDHPTKPLGKSRQADDEEGQEQLSEPDDETIKVEEEADLIRFQRFIEGEEEKFQPVRLMRLDEGNSEEPGQGTLSCDMDEGWIPVKYSKKRKPFIWQHGARNKSTDESTEAPLLDTERGNDTSLPRTPNKKKKRKKKKNKVKIEITLDDISRVQKELPNEAAMTANEAAGVDNVWLLSSSDRLRMYSYWLECHRGRYKMEIQRGEQGHDQLCFDLEVLRAEEEEQVLRRATVVGMTTSCAARYHSTLQRIAPKIVVIEEAAEVMEAHILTSLSRDTEHTILIGDHKQLRPKATVYELAQKYNLEISLFERMVTNKMDCKRLNIQHRMRPEIAELTKSIYDHEIVDHESVCQFNDISGVGHNLFFINHCQPERLMGGLQSYCNSHEAEFLVAFCNYLLLQGYKPEQITILTMYTGQLLELREKMPRSKYEGVKVCAVDNFQGEENDIILLSLVRSNTEGRVGFLKDANRICVALSRARQGFYCIGNFNLLSSECKLWKEICVDMKTKRAISETLQLVCKRHKNVNEVKTSTDFERLHNGGCGKPCEDRLNCGHACYKSCHPTDLKHMKYQCRKQCSQCCPNEHQCQMGCHYPRNCTECPHLLTKTIPQCGHNQTVPCGTDAATFVCRAKCEKVLECGHNCTTICGRPCTQNCQVQCEKELSCGHNQTVPCSTDAATFVCRAKCEMVLECGHNCTTVCGRPCTKNCQVQCEQELSCGHKKNVHCCMDPLFYLCDENCNKILECGHPCSLKCKDSCQCCASVEVELSCKHPVLILCREKDHPPKCSLKCQRSLDCGHSCPGICSQDCFLFECKVLVRKDLPCGHKRNVPCHKDREENRCKEKVEVKLQCGHRKVIGCFNVTAGSLVASCDVIVQKKLPCKHKMQLKCSENEEKALCNAPCEKSLPCGHPCPGKCSAECSQYQCQKIVHKKLPCTGKHQNQMRCCDDPKNIVCKEQCTKSLECEHQCPGLCTQDCRRMRCVHKIEKTFLCGHRETLSCFKTKTAICKVTCVRRKVSCEHLCNGLCGEPCSKYPCRVRVVKTLPCGHRIEMLCSDNPNNVRCPARCGKKLQCGHPCSGTCSDCQQSGSHELCRHPCGRLLVCSHRCGATCREPCPPCDKQCRRRCPHGRCTRRCSDPCKPCQLPCTWSCPHGQCNNLCGEICDRVSCNATCPNRLLCGHPCIGLCGENCPTACRVCHAKQLSPMSVDQRGNKEEFTTFLELFDCGHVKNVAEMDAWMLQDLGPDVQYRRCPECPTPITFSYRYGNHIKRTLKSIENVKTQAKQLADETFSSTTNLARDLRSLTPHLPKVNFPWQVDFLSDQERRPLCPHFRDRDVLFLFTLKNQLQILCEIQRTQHVLQNASKERKRWPAGEQTSQRYRKIEELSSVTTSALEQMAEFLKEPQLDLKTLCQLYEHTRKFSFFSRLLEAENQAMKHSRTPLSSIGKTRLKLAHERFMVFLQGNNDALGLEWLEKIVNSLRKEVKLPSLPDEEAKDFENFPGFSRGVWKLCGQGHVYVTRLVVRSGTELPLYIGECHRCGIMENDLEEYEIELEDE